MARATNQATLEADLAARGTLLRAVEHRTWVAVVLAAVGCIAVAFIERGRAELGASDRVLGGAALGIALPLLAYALADGALDRKRLSDALAPWARHGASPGRAGAAAVGALMLLLAASAALLAVASTLAARGFGGGSGSDLFASSWSFALGGAAYGGGHALASTFGKRGGGRKWFLVLDFVLGLSTGLVGAPWPRSHLRNLIGGPPVLAMSQAGSAAALLAFAAISAYFAVRRARS